MKTSEKCKAKSAMLKLTVQSVIKNFEFSVLVLRFVDCALRMEAE